MARRLLVCDLDNTLYDWVSYFVPSFYALVDTAVQILNCDREQLLDDFRSVHQLHGDSEQPFALLETKTVRQIFKGTSSDEMLRVLDPAFHAFNSTRKKNLKLHPLVRETLEILTTSGVEVVAHTESKLYGVVDRLQRLDLFHYFSRIYCRERPLSSHPGADRLSAWLNHFPLHKVVELSRHQTKPDPHVLEEIYRGQGFSAASTCYVGDSIARDILMAKRAGVFAIWAAYGARHPSTMYDKLVRVSHWTTEEVEREKSLRAESATISPDLIVNNGFYEILKAFAIDTDKVLPLGSNAVSAS